MGHGHAHICDLVTCLPVFWHNNTDSPHKYMRAVGKKITSFEREAHSRDCSERYVLKEQALKKRGNTTNYFSQKDQAKQKKGLYIQLWILQRGKMYCETVQPTLSGRRQPPTERVTVRFTGTASTVQNQWGNTETMKGTRPNGQV